jgi:hypothetical protein
METHYTETQTYSKKPSLFDPYARIFDSEAQESYPLPIHSLQRPAREHRSGARGEREGCESGLSVR